MNQHIDSKKMHVIHVAGIRLTRETGMGRIACEWRDAFIRRGYQFTHVGLDEVPIKIHNSLWQRQAKVWIGRQGWNLDNAIWLVHEASSGVFLSKNRRVCVFSHGIERRGRELMPPSRGSFRQTLKSIATKPLWLRYQQDTCRGLRRAWRVLVSNTDDAKYVREIYGQPADRVRVFKNGVDLVSTRPDQSSRPRPTILFVASWLTRKGTDLLVRAAEALYQSGERPRWVLAGVGLPAGQVLASFPGKVREDISVLERFTRSDESSLFADADIFALPTFFEGQSLALLQGMAQGLCCVTTSNCGQKDLIQHGVNGLLFPSGDIQGFIDHLKSAVKDPTMRNRLGLSASASVADRDWPIVGDKLVEWISSEVDSESMDK